MNTSEPPTIHIKLGLSNSTFKFSDPTPLKLTLWLTLSSKVTQPVTLAISDRSPLDLRHAMSMGGFPIFDLTTYPPQALEVTDLTGYINRQPQPPKLICLRPEGAPYTASIAFTRGGSWKPSCRPQPWHIVQGGEVLDEDGNELNIRRPTTVTGLDGLEAGKRYRATISEEKLSKTKWWWGEEGRGEDSAPKGSVTHTADMAARSEVPPKFIIEGNGVEFNVEE